jgi:hypothetical protein
MSDEKFSPTIGEVAKYIEKYMDGKIEPPDAKDVQSIDLKGPGYKTNLKVFDSDKDWRSEVMELPFGVARVEGINTYEYGEFLEGFASIVVPLVITGATGKKWLPEIKYLGKKPLCFTLDKYNCEKVEFYRLLEKTTEALVDIDSQLAEAYNKKMSAVLKPYGFNEKVIEAGFARKVL